MDLITPSMHLSGESLDSPEQGAYAPNPNTTALELQEGHNLRTPLAFTLGSGAVAPRPFAARLRSFLAARILHFIGLPDELYDPNHEYSHATLRRATSYLLERWYFRLVLCCVILAILFGHLLTEAMNPAVIIQVGENMIRAEHPDIMSRAEHPSNMAWTTKLPIHSTDNTSVRRLIRRRTLTGISSPPQNRIAFRSMHRKR